MDGFLEYGRFGLNLGRRPFQSVVLLSPQMSLAWKPEGTRNCRRCLGSEHAKETLTREGFLQGQSRR